MRKIFVRSPYTIKVEEIDMNGSRVELFMWKYGQSVPGTPNFTFTKDIPSASQKKNVYNISNYAKGFIKPINPVLVSVNGTENINNWCYTRVKRYKRVGTTFTLLDTIDYVCLYGYTNPNLGYNQGIDDTVVVLMSTDKLYFYNAQSYVNIFIDYQDGYSTSVVRTKANGTSTTELIAPAYQAPNMYKVPIKTDDVVSMLFTGDENYFTLKTEYLCEAKYTPVSCHFINKFGGWTPLTFFKASIRDIVVTSKQFNLLPQTENYNALQGLKKDFNHIGTKKVKCNTGWVDENYNEIIEELMLSETILIDNVPVTLVTKSQKKKTYLKDKNINFEVEFQYTSNTINDIQ
jgi:hypothetical protein